MSLLSWLGSVLCGCMVPKDTVGYPNDYRKRHQIGLRDGSRTVEVFIGQSRGSLTPTQRAEVLAFAKVWRDEATGGVVVDVPTGDRKPTRRIQRAARDQFDLRGLRHSDAKRRGARIHPGKPREVSDTAADSSAVVAEAGPCGLWPQDLGPTLNAAYNDNNNYWNLGCSNQRNLAAMVANPADLVQPRAEAPSWTSRRTTVLEKYRQGQSPETTYPNRDSGKVSDVAK